VTIVMHVVVFLFQNKNRVALIRSRIWPSIQKLGDRCIRL